MPTPCSPAPTIPRDSRLLPNATVGLPLPDHAGMPAKTGMRMRSRVAYALVVVWLFASMVSALLSFVPRTPDARAQRNSSLVTAGGKARRGLGNCYDLPTV